jgi:hypothetical protein
LDAELTALSPERFRAARGTPVAPRE